MKRKKFASLLLAALCLLRCHKAASADEVYKWVDGAGRVHYSTSAASSGAVPARLPEIKRENLDEKIAQIKASAPPSCEGHGGIDCSQGADGDGSVLCADGFRDPLLPYRFGCLEARLEAKLEVIVGSPAESLAVSRELPQVIGRRAIAGFKLTVRNLSPVKAWGVKASFSIPQRAVRPLKPVHFAGEGPAELEGFGLADYTLSLAAAGISIEPRELSGIRYQLSCTNCRT